MGTALSAMRARLQITLDDATAAYWTAAELDEHIQGALRELSHHIPREQKTTLTTTPGSRNISLALTDLVRVEAVEYKTGAFPPTYVAFSIWAGTLTILEDPIPDGANASIYWQSLHTINGSQTLPTDADDLLLYCAAARACEQQNADSANALNTGGAAATRDWADLATRFRGRYERRLAKRQGLRQTNTYQPLDPLPSQSSDPGP